MERLIYLGLPRIFFGRIIEYKKLQIGYSLNIYAELGMFLCMGYFIV